MKLICVPEIVHIYTPLLVELMPEGTLVLVSHISAGRWWAGDRRGSCETGARGVWGLYHRLSSVVCPFASLSLFLLRLPFLITSTRAWHTCIFPCTYIYIYINKLYFFLCLPCLHLSTLTQYLMMLLSISNEWQEISPHFLAWFI